MDPRREVRWPRFPDWPARWMNGWSTEAVAWRADFRSAPMWPIRPPDRARIMFKIIPLPERQVFFLFSKPLKINFAILPAPGWELRILAWPKRTDATPPIARRRPAAPRKRLARGFRSRETASRRIPETLDQTTAMLPLSTTTITSRSKRSCRPTLWCRLIRRPKTGWTGFLNNWIPTVPIFLWARLSIFPPT